MLKSEAQIMQDKLKAFFNDVTVKNALEVGKHRIIDEVLFESQEEKALYSRLREVELAHELLSQKQLYLSMMYLATLLTQPISDLFDNVYIAGLEESRKANLMYMFERVYDVMNVTADMSKL